MEDEERILDEPIAGDFISGELHAADESPTPKRSKPTPDRLSELPDLAIVHILSHLCFEEAARTSLLSKRFNSLWRSVAGLNFYEESAGKSGNQFVNFVDTALGFHLRSDVEKFSVKFSYNVIHSKAVDGWIEIALQKQVKSLHLNLVQDRKNRQYFEHKLPKFLFSNQKLEELVTCCCKFSNRTISWNSLKLLSITRTKLTEGLISRILSGCPLLETLELKEWTGFDHLKIDSTSLRVLRIVGEDTPPYVLQPDDECLLEISGPSLVSVEISGQLYRTTVRLMDVGLLVDATMDFDTKPQGTGTKWYAVRDERIAREVLESLCFVDTLTIGGWFITVLSTCEAYGLSWPRSERRSLTLSTPLIKWNHLGVASILHSSPYLETLVISISCCFDMYDSWYLTAAYTNYNEEYYWTSWSTKSRCPLLHLKTVKVVNFHASCGAMKLFHFLRFLLGNAKALEEVVIEASQFVTKEAIDESMKLLSDSVPKASPDVVVQLEPPHLWVVPPGFCENSAALLF